MLRSDFSQNWCFGDDRMVNLPHDAMIEQVRDPASPGGAAVGFFPPGRYVYEKTFLVPEEWRDQFVALQFEGVYRRARVSVNGRDAGGRPYGYIPFFVRCDELLEFGVENTVRVDVDNQDMPNSRWYTGAGIYRPVWLWRGGPARIDPEGVAISTLSYAPARVRVVTRHVGGEVSVEISRDGQVVARGDGDNLELEVPDAELWSADSPALYNCRVILAVDGVVVDEVTQSFGIRLVSWGPTGLFVNGEPVLLRGGCVHHDNGLLGACAYEEAEQRRVRIMKEAGFNAIRSAHNPASEAMLEACDRYGMYVMDETWDMWYSRKNAFDYALDFEANYKDDLKALAARDFNHPSVIMYSLGNEVSEPASEKGVQLAREMVTYLHEADPNRAVTAGINLMLISLASRGRGVYREGGAANGKQPAVGSLLFNTITSVIGTGMNRFANGKRADTVTAPMLDALDIAGYNYASGRYELESKAHPQRVIVGSETFPQNISRNWALVRRLPYLVGDFMWTAWDYLGEAGIGAWSYSKDGGDGFQKVYPWLLAGAGAIDILGDIGAEAGLAAVVWGLTSKPYIGVRPVNHPGVPARKAVWRGTNALASWSWRGCEGNRAVVEVYGRGAIAELFLNGRSMGRRRLRDHKAVFSVRYVPGQLVAIVYDDRGTEIGRTRLTSAKGRTSIRIAPESPGQPGAIVYVPIRLCGENGEVESNADTQLQASVEGGELLGFGSADPCPRDRYLDGRCTTHYGRALAIVRCGQGQDTSLKVTGAGLETVETVLM